MHINIYVFLCKRALTRTWRIHTYIHTYIQIYIDIFLHRLEIKEKGKKKTKKNEYPHDTLEIIRVFVYVCHILKNTHAHTRAHKAYSYTPQNIT